MRWAADSQDGPYNFDNELRCYEITTMSLLEHRLIYKQTHQIWTINFLEVVQQHILGVFLQCFIGNSTGFPVAKEFWKSVKIWQNYRHKRVAHFLIWDTV